jgi:hypothetical protein
VARSLLNILRARVARVVVVLALALACDCELLVGIEDRSVARDAGADAPSAPALDASPSAADGAVDAGAEASPDPTCFGRVTRVAEIDALSMTTSSVRFTASALGAYITRAPPPPNDLDEADILFATRDAPDASFGTFAPTSFTRSDVGDLDATETVDGLTVYFDTYLHPDPCLSCRHVWRAIRRSPDDAWGPPEQVIVSPDDEDFEPYALPDDSAVYFVTARDSHPLDLWRAVPLAGYAAAPVPGDGVDLVDFSERAPVVTADDRTLYFARSLPPYTIFVATRSDPSASFSLPRAVTLAETPPPAPHDQLPTWISADGCDLYFRDGRTGVMDIWRARRCDCP